jgi:hypothetical protein
MFGFAVLYYNSIHKSSSFSMFFNGDSIVSKSEEVLFFYLENVLQLFYTMNGDSIFQNVGDFLFFYT